MRGLGLLAGRFTGGDKMNYDARIDTGDDASAQVPFNPVEESEPEAKRNRRRSIILAVVIGAVLIGLWFAMHRGGSDQPAPTAQAATVSVVTPGRMTIAGTISATGTLAPRRELPVGSAGEGGQVAQVLVDAGDWVRQGEVLAVIDRSVQTQQQASAAAQVQVAQADARLAQANLDRALKLVSRGFVSTADVDRLTATRDVAVARVRVASAQLGELQARIRRLNIVAPADGLVLERNIEPGQVVGSGTGVLFRIAKGGEMEMTAQLSENDLAAVSLGTPAQVTPVGSQQSFSGQIWQVSPVINPQTRQGSARIALSYAPELRPGGFASATITNGTVVAPMLPESAILSDNRGSYVYVVGPDNKVRRRDVTPGSITAQGIVVAKGLTGSERIVVRAGAFLAEGETVNPKLVK